MDPLPERTERDGLVLRRWMSDDVTALHETVLANAEHLRPWMPWIVGEPVPEKARAERIATWEEEWRAGGDAVFGMWLGGAVVGSCGLHRRLGPEGLEIGYWVDAGHGGRGIATTAAHALTDLAFTVDGIDHVEIHHDAANVASRRVPEKLGFTLVADDLSSTGDRSPGEAGIDCIWRTTSTKWLSR